MALVLSDFELLDCALRTRQVPKRSMMARE